MIDLKQLRGLANSYKRHKADAMSISLEQIFELLDMLESAQQDQARYEWLRGALADSVNGVSHHFCSIRSADELDSAIDAAMAASKGEQA